MSIPGDVSERTHGDDVPRRTLPVADHLFRLYGDGLVVLTERMSDDPHPDFDVWLHVGEAGRVMLATGKAEVGQNVRTALAQAVCEEIGMSIDSVDVVLADTELSPYDVGTFGSRSTPITAPQVRRASAAARRFLIDIASLPIGKDDVVPAWPDVLPRLLCGRRLLRIVRRAERPHVIGPGGESAAKVGGRSFVTGAHKYAFDVSLPCMSIGQVLRPPARGCELRTVDVSAAERANDVTVVRDGDFVGVVAPTRLDGVRALAQIGAEWTQPPDTSGSDLASLLRPQSIRFRDPPPCPGSSTIAATYTAAYIAHVPLEPRAALALWQDDKLTVWTGTQRPFGVRQELATLFGIDPAQVRVIAPDTGSGYGGKHTGDAAIEAARLARACGKPVKVLWSREVEFQHAYVRPAAVIDVSATVTALGKIADWQFHNTNSGSAGIRMPYTADRAIAEFHEADSPLRQGSYRALAATANNFARECHIDDLAHAVNTDPVDFRLANLDDERLKGVLRACASRFGWARGAAERGRGSGIACGTEKGSYIATAAEVEVGADGRLRLVRVAAAYDCGAIVNRRHLDNQVEGAIVMGIGGALYERVDFENGRVLNQRLSEYRVPRFADTPPIEIELIDSSEPSVGAGETPIIAIAPAISNALLDATGVRLRNLPMAPGGIVPVG